MAVLTSGLNISGIVFLAHAVYSAYEHSLLPSSSIPPPQSSLIPRSLDPQINLPLDILLETLLSVLLLCAGIVLSSPDLKPIRWSVWAGKLERSKEARLVTEVGVGGGNPYAALEERPGFWDARSKHREFAGWVEGSKGGLKT